MKQELYYISTIRAIATILVVLGHSYCCYSVWNFEGFKQLGFANQYLPILQLIHMPIFVFVSGFLFKFGVAKKSSADLLKSRAKRILVPYLFWAMVSVVLFSSSFFYIFKGIHHLWFLLMLWWCFVLTLLINKLTSFLRLPTYLIYIATIVMNIIAPTVLTKWGGLNNVGFYYTFFYLGYIFKDSFWDLINLPKFKLPKLLCVLGILVGCIALKFMVERNEHIYIITLLIVRVLKIAISLSAIFFILILCKSYFDKRYAVVEFINRYSYPIYILHHIIIWQLLFNWMELAFINEHYILTPVILFTVSITLSIVLAKIIRLSKFGRLVIG